MAAVKTPYNNGTGIFPRPFSPVPDSPWPNSAMTPGTGAGAAHNNMFLYGRTSGTALGPSSRLSAQPIVEEATTPSDITAPSPSTSETSTVFTDVDGEEEPRSAQPEEDNEQPPPIEVSTIDANAIRSPAVSLKINTATIRPPSFEEEEPPQSVIHIPSGFTRFHGGATRTVSRLSQTHILTRERRSQSQSSTASARSSRTEPATESVAPIDRPNTAASITTDSTVPSESTLRPDYDQSTADADVESHHPDMASSPLLTNGLSSKDWVSTPRAQTRQELSFSRPGSSLASIREGDDDEQSELVTTEASADELDAFSRRRLSKRKSESEIHALEEALAECWTLCNTLQGLSNRHRDRMFPASQSAQGDERAWKTCWKLCQTLYDPRDINAVAGTKNTLNLCREFCQTLFEVRIRNNEAADSVLRVSFELNNHLFNTHDRALPEAFRERTLDFYITLCHRLMKQKSKVAEEADSLLRACWSLAEMLFSLRQSRRESRKPDQELLSSAMQACWDLCDLFRAGWTQVKTDRGTPRATQATFSEAFQLARRGGYIEDQHSLKITPETPTTIFDDTATISPEEAPAPSISVMDHGVPQSAISTASAPPALPRPNTTQRMSRNALVARANQSRWPSINEVVTEDDQPSRPISALSQSSRASSTHLSVASSQASSQHTIRTPAEDPSLTLLKALFVRAAVQTGRGFTVGPQSTYRNLPQFVNGLPDNAFGSQVWQKNLLENYKTTVLQDSTFRYLGGSAAAIGLGPDPEKGKEEIAIVLKGMVDNTPGWSWLRDLFKYGYGSYIDEVINKAKETPAAPTDAKTPRELPTNGRHRLTGSAGSMMSSTNGNQSKKISPPRR